MSTKDNFCTKNFHSNKTSSSGANNEFMNVNLNVGHKTEELQPMQSKSNSILITQNNKTIEVDEPQQKLNNSSTKSSNCYDVSQMVKQLNLNQNDKNCEEQNGKLEKGAVNNSTLSLHIIAYENGIEQPSNDLLQDEQAITTPVNQKAREDPFSMPRQQKDKEGQKEVFEFHSSDRVMNDRPPGYMPCFFQKEKETFLEWHSRVWTYLQDLSSYRNIKQDSQHQTIMNFADLTQIAAKFPFPLCDITPMESRPFMIMMNRSSDVPDPRGLQNIALPTVNPPVMDNDDTVTYQELYQAYCNFWNSLNNCVDDEYKIKPANGVKPTYTEAKNLWKSMKNPRRRKLLWVATGFIHSEFPGDEEAFRREEAEGLINDTNVTTGADAESESSEDEFEDMEDQDEENIPPVVNNSVNAPQQNALLNGNRPADIADEEAAPQDPINANALNAANNLGLSLNGSLRPDTPLCITQATTAAATTAAAVTDPTPPIISPIRSQMNSMNLSSSATTAAAAATRDKIIQPATTTAATLAPASTTNEVVADSQPDAWVDTVHVNDYHMEEPDISPPRSPVRDDDSPASIPTPESSYPISQNINVQKSKEKTPKRNRIIIHESDSDDNDKKVKHEAVEISYMDEQIASPQSEPSPPPVQKRRTTKSKSPAAKGRKRKSDSPKPSTSAKPRTGRSRTKSPTRGTTKSQKARKTVTKRGRRNDPDYESDINMFSDEEEEYITPPPKRKPSYNSQRLGDRLDGQYDSSGSDDDEVEESSSYESQTLGGFIVNDDVIIEDSSDGSVTFSDSQQTHNSEDSSSSLNDEIYTRDDSVERDIPVVPPRAIVRTTPTTTQRPTPLLAHVGKSRYSSDVPTTSARFTIATPLSSRSTAAARSGQRQTINAGSTPQRKAALPKTIGGIPPARGYGQLRSAVPHDQLRRPRPLEELAAANATARTRSTEHQPVPSARTRTNERQPVPPPTATARTRSNERQPIPPARTRTNERQVPTARTRTRTPEYQKPAARLRTPERPAARTRTPDRQPVAQIRTRTRTPELQQPAQSMKRKASTREPPIQSPSPAPIDSRRSTSSVRFGSLIREGGSDNSRPSSVNSMNSSIPEGYELIDKECKRFVAKALYIIHERNGQKYFHKYREAGTGVFNGEIPCNDFYCARCKTLGKDTYVKILKRSNKTYAEIDHHIGCEMKEYNLEDDD